MWPGSLHSTGSFISLFISQVTFNKKTLLFSLLACGVQSTWSSPCRSEGQTAGLEMQPRHHQCAIHLQSWQQMREAGGRGWRKRPFHFLSGARPAVRCTLLSYRLGFKHWSLPQQPVQCGPCHLQRSDLAEFNPQSGPRSTRSSHDHVSLGSSAWGQDFCSWKWCLCFV